MGQHRLGLSNPPADMWGWDPTPDVHLTFRLTSPFPQEPSRHPARLIVGRAVNSDQPIPFNNRSADLAKTGLVVMDLMPRPNPPGTEEVESPLLGSFYLLGLRAELAGKTLLGSRISDVIYAVDFLAGRSDDITAEASGHEASGHDALVLLHAAVLDPRLKHIALSHLPPTYREFLANPLPKDASEDLLPGVLLHYDIPDLIAALGTRVTILPDTPQTP